MIEGPGRQALIGSAVFALCMALLLFLRLLPLSSGMVGWPGPDIAVCLVFAWVLRRPDQLAAPVIVAAFLVEDIFLLRPLGLWTALVLIATEAARLREHRWREQAFMIEWLRVAILIGVMMLAYRAVMFLFLLSPPALGQVLLQYLATLAAYPVVVFVARWTVGLRRISASDAEMMRYR
ncbi:rod shape-determining protein MreD [Paracoccus seriniphilus]|uniref:Rod shape-determining protein MreD n=1 Tax=Paracoccus seriniphilus TaxID=184748 RepID=A0A239PMR1_9RHOB|nr:rod shape-determining protein MreD [Paracoccus seriniphilus]WCR13571.1 rod shape-determining protein MreD [Paracoccus seriniphilus]SNT68845.1 rod shape-determining protein MreD [Paracoccus seriniphilus]